MNSTLVTSKIKDKQTSFSLNVKDILTIDENKKIKTLDNKRALTVQNSLALEDKSLSDIYTYVNRAAETGYTIKALCDTSKLQIPQGVIFALNSNDDILIKGDKTYIFNGISTNINGTYTLENPHKQSKIKKLISAGGNIYILYEDEELYVMGANTNGSLGIDNGTTQYSFLHSASGVKDIFVAASGQYSVNVSAFILKDDGLFASGFNTYGQLGLNHTNHALSWSLVPNLEDIGEIKEVVLSGACYASSYILTTSGDVYSCGYNTQGQLGLGNSSNIATFTKVTSLNGVKIKQLIAGGGDSTANANSVLALSQNNRLYFAGYNGYSQSGLGDTSNRNVFSLVNIFSFDEDEYIEELISNPCSFTNYFLTNKQNLYAAGRNDFGQLGNGSSTNSSSFIKIFSGVKKAFVFTQATNVRFSYLYLITTDNKLYCCGRNETGVLGAVPVNLLDITLALEDVSALKQIAVSGATTSTIYLLFDDGKVLARGSSENFRIFNANGSIGKFVRVRF